MNSNINLENISKFKEEKQCTWLFSSDNEQVIFCSYPGYYLHIEIIPDNYPGLGIYFIDKEKDCSPQYLIKNIYSDYEVRCDGLNLLLED